LINTVYVVTRLDQKNAFSLASKLESHLKDKGLEIIVEPILAKLMTSNSRSIPLKKIKADLIIAIGGDGTLLKTALHIPKPETPILAVNLGRRGFLTEIRPEDMLTAVDKCINGDYILEKCNKLSSAVGREKLPDALNEFLIASTSLSKVIGLRIFKDKRLITEYYCDGLIIATPTGSTAHSLSAGGSVLDPDLDAFILTPICPLTPTPSIIFSSKNTIQIQLIKMKKKVRVSIDGQYQTLITKKNKINVKKSKHQTRLVRFRRNFYDRLNSRFTPFHYREEI
jgi:NAD+ kinase